MKLTFDQDGFDRTGKIVDGEGKLAYKLKDEDDKHAFSFKSRPLHVSRADGTKIASIHWENGPSDAKLECRGVVWGPESKLKLKIEGEILDRNGKFHLPNGRSYEWDGPNARGEFDILDHQNMRGEGLDMKPTPIARYSPHTETRDATLNVLPKGLAIADLLDAIVLTSFYIEMTLN